MSILMNLFLSFSLSNSLWMSLSSLFLFIIIVLRSGTGYSFSSLLSQSSIELFVFWGVKLPWLPLLLMLLFCARLLYYWLASWRF
jgi:hypothetical protein